jgi:hypothetical protein
MDDATRRYLIRPGIKTPGIPYVIDNERVLELTKQLMGNKLEGAIQEAFDAYVGECMSYLYQRDFEHVARPATTVTPFDNMLLPPKNIKAFVKVKRAYKN